MQGQEGCETPQLSGPRYVSQLQLAAIVQWSQVLRGPEVILPRELTQGPGRRVLLNLKNSIALHLVGRINKLYPR